MARLGAALAVLTLVTSCGPRLCDEAGAAQRRLVSRQPSCAADGAQLDVLLLDCRDRPECTADDLAAIDDYLRCVNLQQPCASPNERVTIEGTARCNTTLRAAVSPGCAVTLGR
jgi:hypothetical protein